MDHWKSNPFMMRLQQMWTTLLAQMDAMGVVDQLIDMYPPNMDEYQQIQCQPTSRKKNRLFLQSIHLKGPEGVQRMLDALAEIGPGQRALAEKFLDGLSGDQRGDFQLKDPQSSDQSDSARQSGGALNWSTPFMVAKETEHPVWKVVCKMLCKKKELLLNGWEALLRPLGLTDVQADTIEYSGENPIELILSAWCAANGKEATINELAHHLEAIKRRDAVDAMAEHMPPRRLKEKLSAEQYRRLSSKRPDDVRDTFADLSRGLMADECDALAERLGVEQRSIGIVRYDNPRDTERGNRLLLEKWKQSERDFNVATLVDKLELSGCWELAKNVAKQHGVGS